MSVATSGVRHVRNLGEFACDISLIISIPGRCMGEMKE